jgi:glycerol-3-phosphate acyltransferase PlsY
MNIILKAIILTVIAYILGSFSFGRLFAKWGRKINIYKVGDGTPDPSNIYNNVSKFFGILVGVLDFARIYLIVYLAESLFIKDHPELLLLIGMAVVIGGCFPFMHRFRGGRGVDAYTGLLFYFVPLPALIVSIILLIIFILARQIRFIQYMIVILVPITAFIVTTTNKIEPLYLVFTSIFMGILNFLVSKRYREI